MKFRRAAASAFGTGFLLVVTACGGTDDAAASDFEPDHIHSLALNHEGRLLVATHDGLFEVNGEQTPTRVGELTTDLMGFTVGKDGTFYASGHPGPGEDGPSALGLVKSTNGGNSFDEVALGGQADFHSLSVTDGTIYGVDGGTRLLRSDDDGANWDEIALPQPVADIAVDPASGAVLATSEAGLLRSTDGGRSFEIAENAPTVQLVDWSADGTVMGIDPSGQVMTTADTDAWTPGAQIDPPQAMMLDPDGVAYVATEASLLMSSDGGNSFVTLTQW